MIFLSLYESAGITQGGECLILTNGLQIHQIGACIMPRSIWRPDIDRYDREKRKLCPNPEATTKKSSRYDRAPFADWAGGWGQIFKNEDPYDE